MTECDRKGHLWVNKNVRNQVIRVCARCGMVETITERKR